MRIKKTKRPRRSTLAKRMQDYHPRVVGRAEMPMRPASTRIKPNRTSGAKR
jgi:hypothetical protein